jgi:tRNA threonylcarbamoyladenosine biosynthesis protein TsaB
MILALNTATAQAGAALLDLGGQVLAERLGSLKEKHYGELVPSIRSLLAAAEASFPSLKAIIVARGPGSFTGLRVGLAAAKGLCHALGIPLIGVSSLEALASQILWPEKPVGAIIDSRKGEVFASIFWRRQDLRLVRMTEERSLRFHEFPSFFEEGTLLVGNRFGTQAAPAMETMRGRVILAPAGLWHLKASAVGSLGLARFLEGDFDEIQDLGPVYLRPPDIRPNAAFPIKG